MLQYRTANTQQQSVLLIISHRQSAILFTVATVILNNIQFYKEYLMKIIADIVGKSNMQQRIATGKSSLYSTKFYIVLQNISSHRIHSKE